MRQYKVSVCQFPGDGWNRKELTWWIARTIHEMKTNPLISSIVDVTLSDTPITMTRNRAVKESLKADVDYILMVDSDMEPDYEVDLGRRDARPFWSSAWAWMMNRRADEELYFKILSSRVGLDDAAIAEKMFDEFPPATIAAPYCGPPPDECCYVFHWRTSETRSPDPKFSLSMIEREYAAKRMGIEPVAALPTGLILYDARVFQYMEKADELPWFEYEYDDPPYNTIKCTTEDVYQTRNASLLKMPQYVCWDSWAKNHKDKGVERPYVLNVDGLRKAFADAAKRGFKAREYIRFVSRHDVPPEKPEEANGGMVTEALSPGKLADPASDVAVVNSLHGILGVLRKSSVSQSSETGE
jgi:hypothetical protein